MVIRFGAWRAAAAAALLTLGVSFGTDPVWSADAPPSFEAAKEKVEAHLAAGEFGLAMQAARSVRDVVDRAALVGDVHKARAAAGEVNPAADAVPLSRGGSGPRGNNANAPAPAFGAEGTPESRGGSGADATELIDLILNQTGGAGTGPWASIDGEGAPDPFFFNGTDTGVRVDPLGLLSRVTLEETSGRLAALGIRSRAAALNADMAKTSHMRIVSLTRLEKAVAERLASGRPALETMRQLAGLSKIQYVFVYPEEGEILVAGPAEAWRYNEQGLPVGVSSGKPTLQLDDLVVVLRTFAPGGKGIFGCSINPRPEGLKAVKEFVENPKSQQALAPNQVGRWVKEIEKKLGLQDIEIYGVPGNTRVGRAIVEADYRMKLIGVGKLDGGKGIPSYFDLLPLSEDKPATSLDGLRWWLTMKYDAILHAPRRDVFEIQGSSVLLLSEDQIVTAQGDRIQTGQSTGTNRNFARNFTANYAGLAARDLVFADLQNIFDLGMVACLTHNEQLAARANWDLGVFAPGGAYRPAYVEAPKTVHSVVNHRVYKGKDIVVQAAGGVRADILQSVKDPEVQKEGPGLTSVSSRGRRPQLPAARWWWDAAEAK